MELPAHQKSVFLMHEQLLSSAGQLMNYKIHLVTPLKKGQ